jgi:adenylate kinase family enzyme
MSRKNDQKIHIIGGAGSGKTTLANWIAEHMDYENYDLDQIGWNQNGKVPLQKRMEKIEQILVQPNWVTEGIFLWWTEDLFKQADLIVWLDIPYPVAAWRIVRRHIRASLNGNNPHSGIRNLISFVLGVRQQYYQMEAIIPKGKDDDFAVTRIAIMKELERYSEKVNHCRNSGDIKRLKQMFIASKLSG